MTIQFSLLLSLLLAATPALAQTWNGGGVAALAGEQGEGVADSEENTARVAPQIVADPTLVPFATEGDPVEIGSGGADGLGEGLMVTSAPPGVAINFSPASSEI